MTEPGSTQLVWLHSSCHKPYTIPGTREWHAQIFIFEHSLALQHGAWLGGVGKKKIETPLESLWIDS